MNMQHIKNVFELYKTDWKRIFKNPMATFLIVALMILPSLYAWFNIKALWDPYGNTGELPIAVYSDDAGASLQDKKVEIGDQVIDTLHKNKQLGWRFVDSKEDLTKGVRSGKYYAGIYLPKEFSQDLLSFTTGTIKKPTIEYYINEKINAIAPKIADKGATSLQEQISSQFIDTASNTLMKVFNEVGYDIDSNLVSINKVKNLILTTNDNLDQIEGYTKEVVALKGKMPEIKEKLNKANQFIDYLPQVDEMGNKLVSLNDKMPQLKKEAAIILDLQAKIPEIQNAGKQLAMVDGDFENIKSTMNAGIKDAKQGLTIIEQVQGILPDIQKLGNQAQEFANTTKEGAEELQKAIPNITQSVNMILNNLQFIHTELNSALEDVATALKDNQLSTEEKKAIDKTLQDFVSHLNTQQTIIQNLVDFINKLPNANDSQVLQDLISRLNNAKTLIGGLANRVTTLNGYIQTGDVNAALNFIDQVQNVGDEVNNVLSGIDATKISSEISKGLTQLITTINTADGLLTKAQHIDFQSLLSSTKTTITNAIKILEKYQKEMPAIGKELHDANVMLNGHMDAIVSGINKGADLYKNDLPEVEKKLALAVDFYEKDWPGIKKDLTSTMGMVNDKLPEVEKALDVATDLIQNNWPSLRTGIEKAAAAIKKGEETADLGEIIKLLKLDANKESEFFTNPVALKTNQMYPMANNGSASTPFYTALCLWVGALLLSSVAATDVFIEDKNKGRFSKRETFVARMLTFLTEGVGQALIVTLGNYFLLGVDVKQPVYAVLFGLLVGLAFMMIVYVLAALFGNIGKGIAIIILVLSISGGGGNYPIQVSGKFFQMINPLLPFTHAVDLLRESAGGIYWPNAWPNIFIMLGLFIFFGVVGAIVYPYLEGATKKLGNMTKESHFFH
ncbi:membrane protein [Enterococcus dispar]|nr:membrane protein [Enterococcus dispar]